MSTSAKGLMALFAVAGLVAGCGGSSGAPDVSGAPASDSATLYNAANLNKVLAQANSELAGSPVTLLKIEPRDVKIVGQSKTITVDSSGNSAVISTPSIPGQGGFNLAVVSPATVQKVVNAVKSKAGLTQSQIAYVAVGVNPVTNKPFYGIYPASGNGHYQANINGSRLKSYGGAGGSSPGGYSPAGAGGSGGANPSGGAPNGGTPGSGAGNSQAIANCVSQAGGDPAKIAACTRG